MGEVPNGEVGFPSYHLPHHAVIKESSTTTKVRMVFSALLKIESEKSLNDLLMVELRIQDSVMAFLLRWRGVGSRHCQNVLANKSPK